jgi:hypothetical protein
VARCPVQVLARGVRPACLSSRGVRLQLSAPHFSSWIRSEALRIGPFNGPSRDASLGELRWGSAVPQRRRHRRPVQLTNLSTLYHARAVYRPAPAAADPASTTGRWPCVGRWCWSRPADHRLGHVGVAAAPSTWRAEINAHRAAEAWLRRDDVRSAEAWRQLPGCGLRISGHVLRVRVGLRDA